MSAEDAGKPRSEKPERSFYGLPSALDHEKVAIVINAAKRIPDGLKGVFTYESKNVGYQAFTAQLRDYAQWAADPLRVGKLIIFLRRTTKLSGLLTPRGKLGTS
jgi:hypothetical protein